MLLMLLVEIALAAVPAGIRPVVAPLDAQAQYDAHVQRTGADPVTLACEPLWEGTSQLCFRIWEGKRRRWVGEADLARWKVTVADLRAAVTEEAPKHVTLERREIVDMPHSFWVLTSGDGWAAAGLLAPATVADALGGGPFRAAVPAEGVFVAWRAGDGDLDHVMAVAVRELYDDQPGAVSPSVYAYDGTQWRAWARAVPAGP